MTHRKSTRHFSCLPHPPLAVAIVSIYERPTDSMFLSFWTTTMKFYKKMIAGAGAGAGAVAF